MSNSFRDQQRERAELLGRLCNEELDEAGCRRLNEHLTNDAEGQAFAVRYLDLQAAIRFHARSLNDEDFILMETQAALDAMPACATEDTGPAAAPQYASKGGGSEPIATRFSRGFDRFRALAHSRWAGAATAALVMVCLSLALLAAKIETPATPPTSAVSPAGAPTVVAKSVRLRGTVGARWAGDRMEMLEGEMFSDGDRLELVEGLAELRFSSGARLIVQGPAILQVLDGANASVSVGRVAVDVPETATADFRLQTPTADLTSSASEFGADIDVDGSLLTRVYDGNMEVRQRQGAAETSAMQLAGGQGVRISGRSGEATFLDRPSGIHFVRYLPKRDTLISLAEVVAGRNGASNAFHSGVGLTDGHAVSDYGAPVESNGEYRLTPGMEFIDGVFIPPRATGPIQIDSIGRTFADFPATSGDCWGGAIMARRPRKEGSLPLIRLEFHGDNYGYVNWLHIASKPDELSPQGHGLIGMHSNCGITFDLHAIRARYPDKKILRFRAIVGNLESRAESDGRHTSEAWVIVDGKLRHRRPGFSREDGPEAIDIPLTDRDRFLVLAVTDDGGDTAYDWVAFGDAIIELTSVDAITLDDEALRLRNEPERTRDGIGNLPDREQRQLGPMRRSSAGVPLTLASQ